MTRTHQPTLATTTLGSIVGALMVLAAVCLGSPPVAGAARDIALYATTLGGWGTAPGSESNPGPTLVVDLGDDIRMTLTSEDPPNGHTFWIDYDNDGMIDLVTEPSSPEFTTTTFFGFTANSPGTFTYYCSIHSGPPYSPSSSIMRGTWITRVPPSIAVVSPIASSSWSGGVPHDIVFNLDGPEPPGNMTVWVNYTALGGALSGSVAGPVPGMPNPNKVSWSPSALDAADVVVNVTSVDRAGRKGSATSAPFQVDSTAPSVVSTAPSSQATGVPRNAPVRVTWSEGMNRTATESSQAFGLVRLLDGVWIAGSTTWSSDSSEMIFAPSTLLDPLTEYEVRVNATGKDDSQPGNFAIPTNWRFTTGETMDTTPAQAPDLLVWAAAVAIAVSALLVGIFLLRRRTRLRGRS